MELKAILKNRISSRTGVSERTQKAWRVDEWLLEIPGQYVKHVCVEVRGESRCQMWENFAKGLPENSPVLVKFDIDARLYQERWYNSVEAWSIEVTNW